MTNTKYTDEQIQQIYVESCMQKAKPFEKTFAEKFREHMRSKWLREVDRFATHYKLRKNKDGSWNSHALHGMKNGKKYPSAMQKYLQRLWDISDRAISIEDYVPKMKSDYEHYSSLFRICEGHPMWLVEDTLKNYKGKIGK